MYEAFKDNNKIVVVVDVLRSTTSICEAFKNGAKSVIPIPTVEEAKEYKEKGYLVACERNGIKSDFADFGNSPHEFVKDNVNGKDVVYSTTNGTYTIKLAAESKQVIISSYMNISAVAKYLIAQQSDVLILCSGWKRRYSLEDSVYAGALAEKLIDAGTFNTICDSTTAALDLWQLAKPDINKYISKAAQRSRLKKWIGDEVVSYCHQADLTDIIPVLENDRVVPL